MSAIHDAYIWLNDPLNWTSPGGILDQLWTHLRLSALAVGAACLAAWPVGIGLGHRGRGGGLVVVVSNISLAVPTLALLTILPLTFLGFGDAAVVLAIAVFAVPPLLANAYTGVREVDREVRDAARGMGLSGWQVLTRVELPLAVPYLAAGFRTAAVQSVATITLAALIGAGGLGAFVTEGFGRQDMGEVLAGGLLTALLCLLVEAVLAAAQRLATPRALRARRRWGLRPQAAG